MSEHPKSLLDLVQEEKRLVAAIRQVSFNTFYLDHTAGPTSDYDRESARLMNVELLELRAKLKVNALAQESWALEAEQHPVPLM